MEGEKKFQGNDLIDQKDGKNAGNFFVKLKNKVIGSTEETVTMHRNEKIITWVIVAVGILAIFLGIKSFSDNIFYPTWLRLGNNNNLAVDNSNTSNPLDLLNNIDNNNGTPFAPKVSTTMDGVPKQQAMPDISTMTIAELRQIMLDSGMAKADLDKLTDQQVTALYQQASASASDPTGNPTTADDLLNIAGYTSSSVAGADTSNNSLTSITSLDQLKNMPISQFRQLLLSSPDLTAESRDILNKMSDGDLQKMLDQQLASTTSSN